VSKRYSQRRCPPPPTFALKVTSLNVWNVWTSNTQVWVSSNRNVWKIDNFKMIMFELWNVCNFTGFSCQTTGIWISIYLSYWTGLGADHVSFKPAKGVCTRFNLQGDLASWTCGRGKRNQCTYVTLCDWVYMSRASQENIAYMNKAVYVVHDSDIRHAIHVHIGAYVVSWFVILARRQN